jgi:hypothetical protein
VWRSVNCIQNVQHDMEGWDIVFCTQVTTLSVLSVLNIFITIFLLVKWTKSKGGCSCHFIKKSKTWIYLLSIVLYAILSVRYLIATQLVGKTISHGSVYLTTLL